MDRSATSSSARPEPIETDADAAPASGSTSGAESGARRGGRTLSTPPLPTAATAGAGSEEDGRFGLSPEAFRRWWNALAEEDRVEFSTVYGGTEDLARFVCAVDYFSTAMGRGFTQQAVLDAYHVATGVPRDSVECRVGAAAAWKHDAVQALLDRLRYRSAKQAAARITNRTTLLLERALAHCETDPNPKEWERVIRQAIRFLDMVRQSDVQEQVERTKRGFQRAREELTRAKAAAEEVTPEQAVIHVRMLAERLGPQFQQVLSEALAGGMEEQ